MNRLLRAAVIGIIGWTGISVFRAVIRTVEEEDLARHSGGESDFQRSTAPKPEPRARKSQPQPQPAK